MAVVETTSTSVATTMVEALRQALIEEMERDEDVVILGDRISNRGIGREGQPPNSRERDRTPVVKVEEEVPVPPRRLVLRPNRSG